MDGRAAARDHETGLTGVGFGQVGVGRREDELLANRQRALGRGLVVGSERDGFAAVAVGVELDCNLCFAFEAECGGKCDGNRARVYGTGSEDGVIVQGAEIGGVAVLVDEGYLFVPAVGGGSAAHV